MHDLERTECLRKILQHKIDTLKANREQVGEEILKKKYTKAYNKLLKDIQIYSQGLLIETYLRADFRTECMPELEEVIEKFTKKIMNEYDIQGAIDFALDYLCGAMSRGLALLRFELTDAETDNVNKIEKLLLKS